MNASLAFIEIAKPRDEVESALVIQMASPDRLDQVDKHDPPPDDAMKALVELFSSPRVRAHAHFRYRIGGPTEVEKAFDSACKEVLGRDRDKEHKRWVRRLRRLGLISRS